MFDSHLGNDNEGPKHLDTSQRNVHRASEVDALAGEGVQGAHGAIVSAREIAPDRVTGGSRGSLEGAPTDPRGKMHTVRSLPQEAAEWQGSASRYRDGELPPTDPYGHGFRGSTSIVNASDLERVDAAHATSQQAQQAPQRQMAPGAYQLSDGRILLVDARGAQQVVTVEQYQQLVARAQQQQQSQGLIGRIAGAFRRQ